MDRQEAASLPESTEPADPLRVHVRRARRVRTSVHGGKSGWQNTTYDPKYCEAGSVSYDK